MPTRAVGSLARVAARAGSRVGSPVLEAALTLWLLATPCFVLLLRAAPGGTADTENAAPPAVQAALVAQYHLDQSLIAQYGA